MALKAERPASFLVLRLYRSLLRAAKPFTSPSPDARVLNSLLSRTGIDDHIVDWNKFVQRSTPETTPVDQARDLTISYYDEKSSKIGGGNIPTSQTKKAPHRTHQRLFRRLLREVVCGGDPNGRRKCSWPSQVNPTILTSVIRREFRDDGVPSSSDSTSQPSCQSVAFDPQTRQQTAFLALRELNKKLSYFDYLQRIAPTPQLPQQAAVDVSPLPMVPNSSYLQPGAFLLAHPHMNDSYFSKTVICILEHKENSEGSTSDDYNDEEGQGVKTRNPNQLGQTYGLIVNRASANSETGKNRTLAEAFEDNMLPGKLAEVFGDSVVREGGPVHVSLQMLHSLPSPTEMEEKASTNTASIGGRVIPKIPDNEESSTALYSDRATLFQGKIFKAMAAVEDGYLDRDDVAFFVGASTWSVDQLSSEIAQGFWIPCRGPPEMALTGVCEHEPTPSNGPRPVADLWLSMMSACGEDEAKLSHLYYNEEDLHDNGLPCDAFEEDDVDFL